MALGITQETPYACIYIHVPVDNPPLLNFLPKAQMIRLHLLFPSYNIMIIQPTKTNQKKEHRSLQERKLKRDRTEQNEGE
jgi:hypothetical protein